MSRGNQKSFSLLLLTPAADFISLRSSCSVLFPAMTVKFYIRAAFQD